MKTLTTLIRLHKSNLDGLRRQMSSLENQKSQLQQTIKSLQNELDTEIKLAGKQPEMANFFGEFAKRIKTRQENIHQEIKTIDKKISALNEEIFIAFTELKKYEIAKENAIRRKQEEEKHKETIMLDEISAQQYRKRKAE